MAKAAIKLTQVQMILIAAAVVGVAVYIWQRNKKSASSPAVNNGDTAAQSGTSATAGSNSTANNFTQTSSGSNVQQGSTQPTGGGTTGAQSGSYGTSSGYAANTQPVSATIPVISAQIADATISGMNAVLPLNVPVSGITFSGIQPVANPLKKKPVFIGSPNQFANAFTF